MNIFLVSHEHREKDDFKYLKAKSDKQKLKNCWAFYETQCTVANKNNTNMKIPQKVPDMWLRTRSRHIHKKTKAAKCGKQWGYYCNTKFAKTNKNEKTPET